MEGVTDKPPSTQCHTTLDDHLLVGQLVSPPTQRVSNNAKLVSDFFEFVVQGFGGRVRGWGIGSVEVVGCTLEGSKLRVEGIGVWL